jgi:hypothetical protein
MILVVDRVLAEVRAGESCRSPLFLGSPRRLLAAPQHPQPIPRTSSSMPEGGPELEDIVRGTDERPFAVQANSSCFVLLIKACSSEGGRSLPLCYRNTPTQANPT